MIAIIKSSTSIARSFYYNENKVSRGIARCLAAENYPKLVADLTPGQKLNRLVKQAALNENVKHQSVHISLNFDPSERLSPETLIQIAGAYMEGIGFGQQPYLVYEHLDAAHPHIHIVTTKIRADGRAIDMYNIGRNQSEKARKAIEKQFELVQAQAHKRERLAVEKPLSTERITYGNTPTKQAIVGVLNAVLTTYRYTSLAELNAVLSSYGVRAELAENQSVRNQPAGNHLKEKPGLVYSLLDEKGQKVGVPIPASKLKESALNGRPTGAFLERQYKRNESLRQPYKSRVKYVIDRILLTCPLPTVSDLVNALTREGIHTVLRQNQEGLLYGITYVDNLTKCVFNGSALGKSYSAKAIQERCESTAGLGQPAIVTVEPKLERHAQPLKKISQPLPINLPKVDSPTHLFPIPSSSEDTAKNGITTGLVDKLLQTEHAADYVPHQLKKRKSRKKKRNINHF